MYLGGGFWQTGGVRVSPKSGDEPSQWMVVVTDLTSSLERDQARADALRFVTHEADASGIDLGLRRIPAAISANAWLVRCGIDHFSRVPASGFTDQHLPQRAALRRRCALLAKTTDTHPGDDRAAPAGDVADRRSRRDPDSSPCGFRVACPRRRRCNAEWGDTQPLNNAVEYSPAESEVTLRS